MYKSKLQELCHKRNWELPVYATVKDGPDHCPRFTSTVTIKDLTFESPKNLCRSSKESQNLVSKIALDHINSAQPQVVSPAISPPSAGSVPPPGFGGVNLAKNNSALQQKQVQNSQTSLANQSPRGESKPKDLHVYKNRLQHYTQKKNLTLPEYSCEIDGPPHARKFKASVKIGENVYSSPAYFSTLKDSEHAAAKVAFDSLSVGEAQEDEGLYKTLLQELAQKKGFRFPSYTTITNGPPHMRTFASTVGIGGESFQGREFKSKKLAEMNAAKVAYSSLMEREASDCFSAGDKGKGNADVRAGISQPIASKATETHIDLAAMGIGEIHSTYSEISPVDLKNNAVNVPSSSVDSSITRDWQQQIQTKSSSPVNENDEKAKELSLEEFDDSEKTTAICGNCGSKIVVYPRQSRMKIPEGATVLPCSDERWVAVVDHQTQ